MAVDSVGDVAAMLVGTALDIGEQRWDDAVMKSLSSQDRRAYQKAGNDAYSAQNQRVSWLKAMFAAALGTARGRAHLVTIVTMGTIQPAVRELSADALFASSPSPDELTAISHLWELPEDALQSRRRGARAILLLDANSAFDRLSSALPDQGLMHALRDVAPKVDARWLEVLLAFVQGKDLNAQFLAMSVLERFEPDPRITSAVLVQLGDDPTRAFISPQVLALLARGADSRAVPYLLYALEKMQSSWHPILEALATANDPIAIHGLRRWHQRLSATMPTWPGVEAAARLIVKLEALGPVPDEPAPVTAQLKKRSKRKLSPAPKLVVPKAEALEAQRADLVKLLGTVGLEAHADELLRPAIELVAKRTKESKLALGKTRIGGCPDLPRGVAWPTDGTSTFGFVAQFDLDEVATLDLAGALPQKGLLSFFVMDESEGGYLEHAKVLYFEDVSDLVRAEVPLSFDRRPDTADIREPYPACGVMLRPLLRLPSSAHARVKTILTSEEQKKYETLDLDTIEHNMLLGYREQSYAETASDEALLLQITSDDQAAMEWGDVETLSFMIRLDDLEKRDFSKVSPRIGDG